MIDNYEKYWFVLPVHEVALKQTLVLNDVSADSKDGLTKAKILSMVILGLSALTCSVLPIGITKFLTRGRGLGKKGMHFMGILLRFGGGILLATTFIHLLPEVREGYENLQEVTPDLKSWPENLPELIMCVGFFMMYGIEEVAHKCLHKAHGHGRPEEDCIDYHHDSKHRKDCVDHEHAQSASSDVEARSSDRRRSHSGRNHESHEHSDDDDNKGHSHVIASGTPVRGLLIIIALSIHQIFEGLAVGLETDTSHVWMLLGAVAAHKLVIAFCVGFEIASASISFLAATSCVAIFAVASPIGIGIGIGLSSGTEPSQNIDIASVILQGFATGTLLFVVFFEVLTKTQEEHDGGTNKGLIHFFSAIIGFTFMTILLYNFTD